MSVGYVKDCNSLDDLIDSIHRDNFREEKQMGESEINEDNCVLSDADIKRLAVHLAVSSHAEREFLDIAFLKINKLNDLAKHEMLMADSRKKEIDMASLLS